MAERVVSAVKGLLIAFVQRRAIEVVQFIARRVHPIRYAHGAQVTELATGIQHVVGHIFNAVGGAVQQHRSADGLFYNIARQADFLIDHIGPDKVVTPAVAAHAPAAGEQILELIAIHVPIAVEARSADIADFADLLAHDLDVSGNAEFLVMGNGKAV